MNTVFAVCLIAAVCAVSEALSDDSGKCGINVTWSFNSETAELTIEGQGQMENYTKAGLQPWASYDIKTVDIKEGVTTIGSYAFAYVNCSNVLIPSSVRWIGDHSFAYTSDLAVVAVPKGVEIIGESAFFSSSLSSITLSETVTTLDANSFAQTILKSVTIPSSVKTIGNSAFAGSKLRTVKVPSSVVNLGTGMFRGCDLMSSAELEYGISTVSSFMFAECHSLKDVVIPSSVKTLEGYCFQFCPALTNLIIPEGVEEIYSQAFLGCTGLKSVSFPDTLSVIIREAFLGCKSLTGVVLPASLTEVDDSVFAECTSLNSLFFLGAHDIPSSHAFSSHFVANVCVPSYYNSSTLLGQKVSTNSSVCEDFENKTSQLYNHCFQPAYIDGSIVEFKKVNATEWESQTDECVQYVCDNQTGGLSWLTCNTTNDVPRMCLAEQCLAFWESTIKGWFVEIEFDGVKYDDVNKTELVDAINDLSGISINKKAIGVENDEDLSVRHIALAVEDNDLANTIADAVKKIEKGSNCKYGILCHFTKVSVLGSDVPSSSSSDTSGAMIVKSGFIAMILLAMSTLMM